MCGNCGPTVDSGRYGKQTLLGGTVAIQRCVLLILGIQIRPNIFHVFDEPKKDVSIDELAAMTACGFQDIQTQLKSIATKDAFAELRAGLKGNFHSLQQNVTSRLDLFLKTIRQNFEQRLSKTEADIHELQEHV